jgi:transketolase
MTDTLELARNIRKLSIKMVHKAKASHIGSALSIADIIAVLYGRVMTIDPKQPNLLSRDRFILSKGHACVAVYAALACRQFFPEILLDDYATDHSTMMSHISHKVAGVEFSTGSLGHGLPFAVGKALAAKISGANWRIFVLLGDGELAEGANWEALTFAAHHQLDNLTVIIDYNKLQSFTTVEKTLRLEPLADKATAFGWSAREVDGHNHQELITALEQGAWHPQKPSFLIAHTTKGKGVSYMENRVEWHYKNPSDEQMAIALKELDNA